MKLLQMLDGWKRIMAWGAMQIPGLSAVPGLRGSVEKVLTNPSKENIIEAVLQVALGLSMAHGIVKNNK